LIRFAIANHVETGDLIAMVCIGAIPLIQIIVSIIVGTKEITVSSTDITVRYLILRKKKVINYNEIAEVNTYRLKSEPDVYGYVPDQNFVIELKNGKTISFGYQEYTNYNELKAAIYKYKLGIGA
jgi:hypothetical protein